MMDKSIQTLSIVRRLFPMVLTGEKTSTIRWHEARIVPGTDAAYLGKTEEWPEDVMLTGMREHYPEIEFADIIQVIEHAPANQTTD